MRISKSDLKKLILEYLNTPEEIQTGEAILVSMDDNAAWDQIAFYIGKASPGEAIPGEEINEDETEEEIIARGAAHKDFETIHRMFYNVPPKGTRGHNPRIPLHTGRFQPVDLLKVIKALEADNISNLSNNTPEAMRNATNRAIKTAVQGIVLGNKKALETIKYSRNGNGSLLDGSDFRRVLGLQSTQEQERDKSFLRRYQSILRSTDAGKDMIEDFTQGRIAIFHSISYESWASGQDMTREKRDRSKNITPFSSWVNNHQGNSNSIISTVAVNNSIDDYISHNGSNARVIYKGLGFIMKGYPVMVSREDVMSQNLGSIPQGLIDFHKESGAVKRASPEVAVPIYPDMETWEWADEVLLDNWSVKGVYITLDSVERMGLGREEARSLFADALSLGLPLYVYTGSGFAKFEGMDSVDNALNELPQWIFRS